MTLSSRILARWRRCRSGDVVTENEAGLAAAGSAADLARLAADIGAAAPTQACHLLALLRDALQETGDEYTRYRAAEALAMAVYPKYKFSEYARIFLEDEEFLGYYKRFMDPDNWHSLDRKYTLNQLLRLARHLEGDLAECGTYKGMSAYLMCQAHKGSSRLVHLFDSFEGLPPPDDRDGTYWFQGALKATEDSVREVLAEFDNYRTYKGWIPERFVEVAGRDFSFVHIDVDLYEPTLASLEFFYPRTVAGAVILLDDYGFKTCPGAKLAADEFFASRPEEIVMLSTGQAFVMRR